MRALITGASSGLGRDFAIKLSNIGYDLVLVSRNKEKLEELKGKLKTNVIVEAMDLSIKENVYKIYNKYQNKIDFLINNAGFGECGDFNKIPLENELNMIKNHIFQIQNKFNKNNK